MKELFLSENFRFFHIQKNGDYHTDNRNGSPSHFLALMQKGRARIVSEQKTIHIKEGDAFFIPKNLPYQSYWYGDDIDFLSFGFLHLPPAENQNYALQVLPADPKHAERIAAISTPGTNIDSATLGRFYAVLAEVIPLLDYEKNDHHPLIEAAISYFMRHSRASVPEVAKACGISVPYLYTLFQKYEHTTPNEFRQKALCQKAIDLLLTTDKTVEEISRALGFSSAAYFRKVLKKHTAHTPKEIRKKAVF